MANADQTPQSFNLQTLSFSPHQRLIGYCLLWLLLVYWSIILLSPSSDPPWLFIDNFNLLIHEAGHWIFAIVGQFMSVLGGSLNQCLIPAVFLTYFSIRRDWEGAAFALFWLGDNLINVSYYIGDAQAMTLPLLGGDSSIHDWNWLLTSLGWLQQTDAISLVIKCLGMISIMASIALLSALILQLWTQLKSLKHPN